MGNLITFEAAARTGSFTKAALELAVGQPAVSHAIRLLGDDLGEVPFDAAVRESIQQRLLLLEASPGSPAAVGIAAAAGKLLPP